MKIKLLTFHWEIGEYEQELPSVLINGAEKQKVYQRAQALSAGKRKFWSNNASLCAFLYIKKNGA